VRSIADAKVSPSRSLPTAEIGAAVDVLAAGGLVAYPTETVWGLGALALREDALAALRRFKGRDEAQPISILVSAASDLADLGLTPSTQAVRLMDAFWPGPLTLVMPCAGAAFGPGIARSSDGAVGVRCSTHPIASALAAECARRGLGPITATSLNRSGDAPVKSRVEAIELCLAISEGPIVLPAGPLGRSDSQPSTVVDLCVRPPRVLRAGAIDRAMLQKTIGPMPEKGETQ